MIEKLQEWEIVFIAVIVCLATACGNAGRGTAKTDGALGDSLAVCRIAPDACNASVLKSSDIFFLPAKIRFFQESKKTYLYTCFQASIWVRVIQQKCLH